MSLACAQVTAELVLLLTPVSCDRTTPKGLSYELEYPVRGLELAAPFAGRVLSSNPFAPSLTVTALRIARSDSGLSLLRAIHQGRIHGQRIKEYCHV